MPTAHALLSPSSSKRWMTCSPSARACESVPRQDTPYTLEGTLAHSVAEMTLNYLLLEQAEALPTTEDMLSRMDFSGLDTDGIDITEMFVTVYEGYVCIVYAEYLSDKAQDPDTELQVEAELKLDSFIPEGFGSSDAVIITDNRLRVFDLKYGKGVKVEATANSQMMCYALGALYGPGEPYLISWVEMTIIQPRLHHISSYELRAETLSDWGHQVLKPAAEKAFRGEGEYIAGDHCRFCPVAHKCKALARYAESSVSAGSAPTLMTAEEVGQSLLKLDTIKAWISAIEEYALNECLEGRPIPGWKVVEGRSVRKITDVSGAVSTLVKLGWDEEQCYKPRELHTITELERMVGKKNFPDVLGAYVVKPQGKPTLAQESDPRPVFSPMQNDFKDC